MKRPERLLRWITTATLWSFATHAWVQPSYSSSSRSTISRLVMLRQHSHLPWGTTTSFSPSLRSRSSRTTTLLYMSSTATFNENETDPFKILNLDPTADKAQIKRAYKRMALKFHPDVVTNKDSSSAERKAAGDRFAKINWAYETLSGKGTSSSSKTSTSSTGRSSGSTSTSTGWEPPHRRKGPYSSTTSSSTSDWRDFIPNMNTDDYNDGQYDAGGDSFSKIFADLFAGAASGAAGGAGIFKDFVEFLENNVDGVAGDTSDADLRILLQTGTTREIGDEMDDTQLLVDQLETKLRTLQDEVWTLQAEMRQATRYRERIELEEQVEELQARRRVVQGYERKARQRLVALQTRYKELLVSGRDNERGYNGSRQHPYKSSPYSSSSSSSSSASPNGRDPSTSSSSRRETSQAQPNDKDEAWKSESFGSFGRGGSSRGRSRRSRSARPTEDVYAGGSSSGYSSSPSSSYSSSTASSASSFSSGSNYSGTPNPTSSSSSSGYSSSSRAPSSPSSSPPDYVPPHRRTSSTVSDDKRRLRELKVDEEFDKLKRELGL